VSQIATTPASGSAFAIAKCDKPIFPTPTMPTLIAIAASIVESCRAFNKKGLDRRRPAKEDGRHLANSVDSRSL